MSTVRLRVSDLDAWERFVRPEREEFAVSPDDFLSYLRRESEETEPMRAGKAFHSLMERVSEGQEVGVWEEDGYTFSFEGDFEITAPLGREEECQKVYQTPAGPVLLRGRVDGRTGIEVCDYKLTTATFNAERYASSWQWRAYLDMTGARRFRYEVFKGSKRMWPEIPIYEIHPLTLHAYPEMRADVVRQVGELAEFVREHVPSLIIAEDDPLLAVDWLPGSLV